MNPKYNKYLKKQENYKRNLEKRNGYTKKYQYLEVVSDGIEKSEKRNPMDGMYQFCLTRNSKLNKIVTREKYTYRWTQQAKVLQKLYHDTKNGIPVKPTKPIELFWNVDHTKEEIKEYFNKKKEEKAKKLESRPFSKFHHSLVAGLYINPTINILKKAAEKEKHENKIKEIIHFNRLKKTKKDNEKHLTSLGIAA